MRIVVVPALAIALVAVAGCGADRARTSTAAPAPAATAATGPAVASYSEGGTFTPYYGEELYDGRIYVFGSKVSHQRFKASHQPDPINSKTYIRSGPNKETVVVQTDKDQPQLTDRIWTTFRERHHVS